MDSAYRTSIKNNIAFLLAGTAHSRSPPASQQSESVDMDDVDEYIRNNMEPLNGNSTATSHFSRSSLPDLQPSLETVQQPDRDRVVVAPVVSTSRASAGIGGASRQASNTPHVENVKKSQNCRSEVVAPVAFTSRACAGAASVARQDSNGATVEIVEQPLKSRRFRYDCEIASAGAIQGVQSTEDQRSFPKIKIGNYEGPAEITVSLVCKDKPYRVHPNGIVGKKKSSEEDFTYIHVKQVQVTRNNCVIQFNDLGIRIVKPTQIDGALRLRQDQNVDPFGEGFSHRFNPKNVDLQAVRLCFHVKLAEEHKLDPVVSDVISHVKNSTIASLQINEVAITSRSASNTSCIKIIIWSPPKKLNPKDVEVVFYKKENGKVVWERCVRKFDISDESGIVCTVPPYTHASDECDTEVNVVLRRPSDGTYGDPIPFTHFADPDAIIQRKRKTTNNIIQDLHSWTPPATLPPAYDSETDQNWRIMPGPFDDNPQCVTLP